MTERIKASQKESKFEVPQVILVRNITDPREITKRTGGTLEFENGVPRGIKFGKDVGINWRNPKRAKVLEAVPFLDDKESGSGLTLSFDAAVLRRREVVFVNPGSDKSVITGFVFSRESGFGKFEIPSAVADPNTVKARDLALRQAGVNGN